jgi:peptide/nickel transport system permease protein
MTGFLLRKLAGLAATLLVASFLIYAAMYVAPGDPATLIAGGHATPELLAEIRTDYHLTDPLPTRYWDWLTGVLHGNLGRSFVYRVSVTSLLGARIGNTLFLVIYASLLILLIGIGLGVISALLPRTGQVITVGTSIGLATPSFVAAIILMTVFAVHLRWFPVLGGGVGFVDRVWHLTLPSVALALSWLAYVAQITKVSVRDELDREHVDTARARGLSERKIIRKHVLRNAMIPITTVSGLTVAGLLTGTVVVETAFGIAGIGSFLLQSVSAKDFAVVQAISLIVVATFVIVNASVDVLNGALDPRVRFGATR